jgi:hypothetical protein
MTGKLNAGRLRYAALAAAILVLCLPASRARCQYGGAVPSRSAPGQSSAPRFQNSPNQPGRQHNQNQPTRQFQGRPQQNLRQHPAPGYPAIAPRPPYQGSPRLGPGYPRPGGSVYGSPMFASPGHLGGWLNQHRGIPVQEQERMLRADPSFRHLNPADQQRLMQQLHQVDQMPEEQRQRRLARTEMIERLSPQERMRINLSARRWAFLPPDRQAIMKNAFQGLRAVPLDQRQTVLNSARYQGAFSPEERGILSDMLRVEPYQPVR